MFVVYVSCEECPFYFRLPVLDLVSGLPCINFCFLALGEKSFGYWYSPLTHTNWMRFWVFKTSCPQQVLSLTPFLPQSSSLLVATPILLIDAAVSRFEAFDVRSIERTPYERLKYEHVFTKLIKLINQRLQLKAPRGAKSVKYSQNQPASQPAKCPTPRTICVKNDWGLRLLYVSCGNTRISTLLLNNHRNVHGLWREGTCQQPHDWHVQHGIR